MRDDGKETEKKVMSKKQQKRNFVIACFACFAWIQRRVKLPSVRFMEEMSHMFLFAFFFTVAYFYPISR